MAITAIRGATPLADEIELRAYLASLLRLENVAILLGAGASVPAGGKTIKDLWKDFLAQAEDSAQWLVDNKFIAEDAIAEENEAAFPNLEELGDELEIALCEWTRQDDEAVVDIQKVRSDLHRAVVRASQLDEDWWSTVKGAEDDEGRLQYHRSILQKLISSRQPGQAAPWIFTTNYDLAIEWAVESLDLQLSNGFLGVHSRRFSPQSFDIGFRNIQARGEARFGVYNVYLAKLHGSLTWKEEAGQIYEVSSLVAGQSIKKFLEDAGETDLGLMVMPRAAKYMQTVGYILGELFRRFSEYLSKSQSCLIVSGYGFGDEHINRMLRSALLNPTLQLVIYLPEFQGDVLSPHLPEAVRKLLALKNPRVTVVGGGADAYIDKLAEHLPNPILFDDDMRRLERQLREEEGADENGEL